MHLAEVAAGNEACLEEPQGEVEVALQKAAQEPNEAEIEM